MQERRTVWIADDAHLDRERARRALASNFRVETFEDGAAVLERLSSGARPDVLVLDWFMPGVSGAEVCRHVRALPDASTLAVLFLTVRAEPEQIAEGLQAGANDYLGKPFAEVELTARVAALLRSKELLDRAEQAEETLREFIESSPDALLCLDANARIALVNPEAARLLGHAPQRLTGVPLADVLPELAATTQRRPAGASRLQDLRFGDDVFEPTLRTTEGGVTTIALRKVTEQRKANERRLDLYSIVAHDLRSPLSAMLLRTELLVRGKHGLLSAPMVDELRALQRNISSLVALINDFLDLARLDGTSFSLEQAEFDFGRMVAGLCDELRPLADASKLVLETSVPEGQLPMKGDRARLSQVVTNLLSNAIKFTPEGGRIDVRIEDGPQGLTTLVQDTGVGIPPDLLPNVFQRYVRGGGAQRKGPSTGLGLLIVREIVEAHGGTVGVQSSVGEGSTFWFRLPSTRPSPALT